MRKQVQAMLDAKVKKLEEEQAELQKKEEQAELAAAKAPGAASGCEGAGLDGGVLARHQQRKGLLARPRHQLAQALARTSTTTARCFKSLTWCGCPAGASAERWRAPWRRSTR